MVASTAMVAGGLLVSWLVIQPMNSGKAVVARMASSRQRTEENTRVFSPGCPFGHRYGSSIHSGRKDGAPSPSSVSIFAMNLRSQIRIAEQQKSGDKSNGRKRDDDHNGLAQTRHVRSLRSREPLPCRPI